jgi:dihydroneopterin aldolase
MNSDPSHAFAHPEARSLATAGTDLRDRISLRDHTVEVEIGAFQPERGHTQRVMFNVVVEVRPVSAPLNDDVDRILSYDRITWAIATELAAERLNLLETLAERVADRILAEPQAMRVFVRIEKLDVGPYKLGVEIVRSRTGAGVEGHQDAMHPLVVYLGNERIAAPDLSAHIDAFLVRGAPVVFAVGLPETASPQTGHKPTQRRIDLLAIEQNAWALAARDARCVVVATRTEIDWAMKRNQPVVWGPSKMVLDAVDGPKGTDPIALALWLAEEIGARACVVDANVSLPAGSRVTVERA